MRKWYYAREILKAVPKTSKLGFISNLLKIDHVCSLLVTGQLKYKFNVLSPDNQLKNVLEGALLACQGVILSST